MHGDANALLEAGRERACGSTLYVFGGTPCSFCARMIVNAGVVRVVCQGTYPDTLALDILDEAHIPVVIEDD